MSPQRFFDNFALLADTPNGVLKLRQVILQLGIRGKLVPQDATDEPANILAKRISQEKLRLVESKVIKKTEPLRPILLHEIPYQLPSTWIWQRIDDVFFTISPGGKKIKTTEIKSTGKFPVIDQGQRFIAGFVDDESRVISIPGPVIIFGDHTCELKFVDFNFVAGADGVKILRPIEIYEPYFYRVVQTFQIAESGYSRHYKFFVNNLFPLPPHEEQKRITNKIEELMRLCDELEAQQQAKRESRVRLNNATLGPLNKAASLLPEEFEQATRRLTDNFDRLYDSVDTVGKLRSTILQLAVQGKLVPQDPQDEPASALLERIEIERSGAGVKSQKKIRFASSALKGAPFALAPNWLWTQLGDLAQVIEYGTSEKASLDSKGVPIFRMNNIENGKLSYSNLKYVPPSIRDLPRLYLNPNELLFNRTNSFELVGKTGIFKGEGNRFTFASYLIRVRLFGSHILADYINLAMNASYFRETQINANVTKQCGQANFNGTKLANTLIPLPPFPEQKRIVAKVDQLMSLCDELNAQLRQAEADSEKLMTAAVQHVLDLVSRNNESQLENELALTSTEI